MEQKLVLVIGAMQTITGIVSMILGVVTLFKATSNPITYVSAPIWMGLLYFISGVLCVYTTSKKTYCMIGLLLLSSIVSLIASMGGIIVSAYGLTFFMNKLTIHDAGIAVVMYACILAITCLEAVCSSVMSVLCCRMAYIVRQTYQQEAFLYYGDVAVTEPVIPPEAIQPPVYNPPAYRPPSPTGVYAHYVSPFEDVNTSSNNNDNNENSQPSGGESNQGQESLLDISTEEPTAVANNSRLQERNDEIQLVELNTNSATSAFRSPNEHRRSEGQASENRTQSIEINSTISNTEETSNHQISCNPFAPSDDEGKDSDDDKLLTDDDIPLLRS